MAFTSPTARFALALLLMLPALAASARVCVDDDAGQRVCLEQPAERIVALSPAPRSCCSTPAPASGWWAR